MDFWKQTFALAFDVNLILLVLA